MQKALPFVLESVSAAVKIENVNRKKHQVRVQQGKI
jgi:hypothetical protein